MTGHTSQPISSDLIDTLSSLLTDADVEILSLLSHPLRPTERFSLEGYVQALFARASSDFARTQRPEDVYRIVSGSLRAISAIASQPDRIVLNFSLAEDAGALFIALDDHPFIISSIAETLSDADIRVDAFLHPVVLFRGAPIASSFIEVHATAIDRAPPLLPRLREMLRNLTRVGGDFAAMKALVSETRRALQTTALRSNCGDLLAAEVSQFLEWINEGCFFFLGAATGTIENGLHETSLLGVWQAANSYTTDLATEVNEDISAMYEKELNLSIRKLRLTSRIHRHATLLHILAQPTKSSSAITSFIGYLTSKAWAHEAQDIPILRKKVDSILNEEGVIPNSHDYKYIVEVIDNMPTDEALATSTSHLIELSRLALGVFSQEESRSVTTVDEFGRRAFTAIVLPPERYSTAIQSTIQTILEGTFQAEPWSSEIHIDSSKKRQFRVYISTPLPTGHGPVFIPDTLAALIISATLPWEEKLRLATDSFELPFAITGIFPADYKAATEIAEAAHDLQVIATMNEGDPVAVSLFIPEEIGSPLLSIFSRAKELSISLATPVLENVGLEVLSAYSYECCGPFGTTHLLKLSVRPYDGEALSPDSFNRAVAPGIAKVLRGEAPNDALNSLLRKANLSIKQIGLLRGYCALLWQVHKVSTKRTMWESLAGAPSVATQLCRIFDWKFNPTHCMPLEERARRASLEESLLIEQLRQVPDITQDRVLRALLSLMRSSVRTNFYTNTDTLSIKLRSQEIEFMPHPRPLFEIFVFSPRIEGTHLRSARVARGGIRWSERVDDYRSEVLGLMKTQRVKNVIIVPSGAKGGFIVKNLPRQGEAVGKAVEQAYREYITALLSLADSKSDETVIHPAGLVIHDDPDPYFVVAADKGTATFSDIANSIAQKDFNFWLGDAFASGGSAGYDHKKYGITAKGGWECVLRHFRDLGINYETEPFSVIGIGDMSGDVFGNALLLNSNMALIAAFNHKHIFIDPKPDLAKAFDERMRLFTTPRSQWSDFSPSSISHGGGVFNRFDKEITLNEQLREALSIPGDVPNVVDGERLVSLVLQAQVDLLWNGGIGTYVKGRGESHADVNDGTNDGVRINADELRARVVGEGGNLGFTQRARIEYALRGGRINTDAIDNSGGVDLSDHEVNLKLLTAPMVSRGELTSEQRNQLLKEVDSDVVESVLHHNRDQALTLTVSQLRSTTTMEQYRYLIRDMHRRGFLDRNRDALPDEAELDERALSKSGLTRPELAVCSAAVKMWIKEDIRSSNLLKDQSLERLVLSYFPAKVRDSFRSEVTSHPLRADIIASELISAIVPVVGISFIHAVVSMNGTTVPTAIKCILAADTILGGETLRADLRALDTPAHCPHFTRLWLDMGIAIREAANWLLATHGSTHSLQEMVNLYAEQFKTLSAHSALVFTGKEFSRFERRVSEYRSLEAPIAAANLLALYRRILPLLEMLWSARQFSSDVKLVASAYSQILEDLRVNELFKFENLVETSSKWEQELVAGSYQEIRRSVSLITGQMVTKGISRTEEIQEALSRAAGYEAIRSTMMDVEELLRQKRPFQVAVLPVITRQLRMLKV